MAKTDPIDPNVPAGGETPRLGNDRIQELARAVAEILNVDHYIGSDGGAGVGYNEDAAGEHVRIKFNAPIATPVNVANKGFVYIKDFSGKAELCFEDEDGNEIQLTSGGVFNPALACGLTGNQTIAGDKTFSGVTTVGDTSKTATSAAPTADAQLANKKYVDDEVVAGVAAGPHLSASTTTIFNGTLNGSNAFQDLDVSGTVGSKPALLFLEVTGNGATVFMVKPKGRGSTAPFHYGSTGSNFGASTFNPEAANEYAYLVVMTDASGKIEIAGSNAATTWTVTLLGYVN
jgi:hypothetical protein